MVYSPNTLIAFGVPCRTALDIFVGYVDLYTVFLKTCFWAWTFQKRSLQLWVALVAAWRSDMVHSRRNCFLPKAAWSHLAFCVVAPWEMKAFTRGNFKNEINTVILFPSCTMEALTLNILKSNLALVQVPLEKELGVETSCLAATGQGGTCSENTHPWLLLLL